MDKLKKCSSCEYTTYKTSNLKRHEKCHGPGPSLNCNQCSYSSSSKFNLERHERSHVDGKQMVHKPQKEHTCPLCGSVKNERQAMIDHFVVAHEIALKETRLNFPNFEDFLAWKEEFERATASRFVLSKGASKGLTNSKTHHSFRCHRDGFFVSRGEGKRHLKKLGSNKINGCCPAKMKVCVDEGSAQVEVLVIETHIGHSNEVGRLHLSSKEKECLAAKIASKVDLNVILDEIREELISGELNRIDLVTRKDLINIAQQFNLRSTAVRDKNDWVSVHSWVTEHMDDCVRFYKPQGVLLPSHPQLAEEDFILVITNDPQLMLLEQYGNDCICLDGTHGLNQYDFELTTLLVVDDLRQGFPSAFMLSNKSDTFFVSVFLESIMEALGRSLSPAVFMSDMSEVYINAWNKVMSPPKSQLFCAWHVDRAWRKNLSKVKGREKKKQVYKTIRTLLQKGDEESFPILLRSALDIFKSDPDAADFGMYFEKEYGRNCHQWAYCYRTHLGLNTNMHLECMHKVLKHYHFQGKKVKRLDLCIHGLMKFIRDKLFGRLISICRGKVSSKDSALRSRHKKAQETDSVVLLKTSETSWTVSSRSFLTTYDIIEGDPKCTCDFRCEECAICIHSYKCSCNDSAIKWNICFHIHYMIMNQVTVSCEVEVDEPEERQLTPDQLVIDETRSQKECQKEAIVKHFSKTENKPTSSLFEDRKKNVASEMKKILDHAQNEKDLEIILNAMAPIIPTIDASNEENIILHPKRRVNTNKKMSPQKSLFSARNKRKKDDSNAIKNPSEQDQVLEANRLLLLANVQCADRCV